jgi:predicted tellurium resistance membrane protein TerC
MVNKNPVNVGPNPSPLIRPRTLKAALAVFFAVLGALLLAEGWAHRHVIFPWEEWYGFYAAFGFVAYVLLVFVAQYVLRPVVMRDEGYYDR